MNQFQPNNYKIIVFLMIIPGFQLAVDSRYLWGIVRVPDEMLSECM